MSTLVGLECGDSVSKPLVSLLSELLNFKLPRCLGSVKIRTVYALVLTRDSDYLGFFFFFISPPQKKIVIVCISHLVDWNYLNCATNK